MTRQTWILESTLRIPDSSLKFHSPGLRIPRKKIAEFQIPQAKVSRILKSGLPLGDQ